MVPCIIRQDEIFSGVRVWHWYSSGVAASPSRRAPAGRRPLFGEAARFQNGTHWRDYLLFCEYFHGDTGAGLVANLIDEALS